MNTIIRLFLFFLCLVSICLFSNKHFAAEKTVSEYIRDLCRQGATTMKINKKNLTSVPEELRTCTQLESLDLRENLLQELPEWFGELKKLRKLHLGSNTFSQIPRVLNQLPELEELYLGYNAFWAANHPNKARFQRQADEDLVAMLGSCAMHGPPSKKFPIFSYFWNATRAKMAGDISEQDIIEFYHVENDFLSSLTKLKRLSLVKFYSGTSSPNLDRLAFERLTQLEFLDLSENYLRSFPMHLYKLSHLHTLDLSFNLLSKLPDKLKDITGLKNISIRQNDFPFAAPGSIKQKLPEVLLVLNNLAVLEFHAISEIDEKELKEKNPQIHIIKSDRDSEKDVFLSTF